MGSHWTDKRTAVAMVGQELARRGWKLYGWKEDRSDAMTDYFDPESWEGVAEHASGAVVCVDVYANVHSGGRKRISYEPNLEHTCKACGGTRVHPGGLTYEEAQASRSVVSPIPYFGVGINPDDAGPDLRGKEKCHLCGGRGHMLKRVESFEVWPTFQANPKGSSWHVERGGRIIARGTGVYSVAPERYSDKRPKLEKLVDRFEATLERRELADEAKPGQVVGNGVTLRPSSLGRTGYVELRFDAKPGEEIRAELKGAGFRWARRNGCWYGPESKLPIRWGGDQGHAPEAAFSDQHAYVARRS